MPAPTKIKTWQYAVNQDLNTLGSGALTDHQRLLRVIKNSLIGFGVNPWTVQYSCNSTVAGTAGDAVDRWTTDANVVFGTGAHSWMVLRQAGLGINVELLLDCNLAATYGEKITVTMAVEGTAFLGGSTTVAPTTTGQTGQLVRGDYWFRGADTPSAAITCALHVMQSTDGECTRIAVYENTLPKTVVIIDKLATPTPALTSPIFMSWFGRYTFQGFEVSDAPLWYFYNCQLGNPFGDAEPFRAGIVRHASTDLDVSLICETIGTVTSPSDTILTQRPSKLNQIEVGSKYALVPCSVYCETAGKVGYYGSLYDFWWGDDNAPNGRGYPTDATPDYVHWRNAVLPWNATTMLTA